MKNFSGITDNLDITTKKYVDDGLASKANLAGNNTFTGGQTITGANAGYSVNASGYVKGSWLQSSITDINGANGGHASNGTGRVCVFDGAGWIYYRTPAEILAEAGGGGGSGDNSKHGYTELTNENLNTITEAGWYRAASGNTCTNRPRWLTSTNPFVLEVEKSTDAYIKQTAYQTGNSVDTDSVTYVRYSSNSGSSWTDWVKNQKLVDEYTQTISGYKMFIGGINLMYSALDFNGSSGSSGQFAMSQGSSSPPKWVNLKVKVNGTTYTADSSGLIDLGTISGGGSVSSSQYNDIY